MSMMTKQEIRALMDEVATTPEQTAKDDAQCLAEDAVEQQVNDALADDAAHNAKLDIIERRGLDPELPDGEQQYRSV